LLSALLATACESHITGPAIQIPGGINWGDGVVIFATRLYGQVSRGDTPAGPGFSVVASIYRTGCDGEIVGGQAEPSTTDAEGRYLVRTYVATYELPPGNGDSRVLCTRLTRRGPLPDDTASVVIPDLVHHSGFAFDSVKVDLHLR
jgi:hypothetical protein